MASIDFIKNRIEGAKKNIAKIEAKIARIQKAQATNWEVNPYYYSESDLRSANKDLEAAKKSLAKYEEDLATANDKAASRNVPAITEFLNKWKDRMTKYYGGGIHTYYDAKELIHEMFKVDYDRACKASEELRERVYGKFETQEVEVRGINGRPRKIKTQVKVKDGDLEDFRQYLGERNETEARAKLEKDLTEEYNRKYDFIIERTNEIVKVITDASGLKVGAKGDLNGFIIGTNGTAKVQTIGAGGYNIQCFHFRTLINRI